MKNRVLLLGGNDRSALAVARSFGRANIDVDIARIGSPTMCESSRYVSRVIDLGGAVRHVRRSAARLREHLAKETYDLVIPMGDAAAEFASYMRRDIRRGTKLAMPSSRAYTLCHDKQRTLEVAQKLAIPVPRYRVLSQWRDIDNLDLTGVVCPCYLKPIYSARMVGDRIAQFRVSKAGTQEQVMDFCRFNLENSPIMVQQECPGIGAGIYLLAEHGRILSMVQQIRLHEPSDGGGSSYRTTTPLDPKLAEYARAFVRESEWHGVAMIEFKGDPDRRDWVLMEVNGRFWGSLALTLRAGLDFPLWLYQLYTGRVSAAAFSSVEPRVYVRQRHLKKDLGWFIAECRATANKKRLLYSWIGEFRHLLSGEEGLDSESLHDPVPAVREWLAPIVTGWSRTANVARRLACFVVYTVNERTVVERALQELRAGRRNILFICKGNICRSAFAEHYIRQRYEVSSVRSAGTLMRPGRRSPAGVEQTGLRQFGVDMRIHRSRSLDEHLLAWAHVILVMDYRNLADIRAAGPIVAPVLLLGSLGRGGPISDPYNRPLAEVHAALDRIKCDVDLLAEVLEQKGIRIPEIQAQVA